MGWSGSLTSSSAVGSSITWTPNNPESRDFSDNYFYEINTYAGNYSVSSFTAPKAGIYKFVLKGSGGLTLTNTSKINDSSYAVGCANGGTGGSTTGYLYLNANQTVYVGAGGVCRAAFVSSSNGSSLASIPSGNLYFVAGAGGSGGAYGDRNNWTGHSCTCYAGGTGGGSSGTEGGGDDSQYRGKGGTQSAGGSGGNGGASSGSYGTGGNGQQAGGGGSDYAALGGRGGDGYYGGGGGAGRTGSNNARAFGAGGGSGYVKTSSFAYNGTTYNSTTSQNGGASHNKAGSVTITFQAIGELPLVFNGTRITELYYNGTKITSLYYNDIKLF